MCNTAVTDSVTDNASAVASSTSSGLANIYSEGTNQPIQKPVLSFKPDGEKVKQILPAQSQLGGDYETTGVDEFGNVDLIQNDRINKQKNSDVIEANYVESMRRLTSAGDTILTGPQRPVRRTLIGG
jgi:hypothetical protein